MKENKIDVSQCEFTNTIEETIYCTIPKYEKVKCEDCPNCYYKQLKRQQNIIDESLDVLKKHMFSCMMAKDDITRITDIFTDYYNKALQESTKRVKDIQILLHELDTEKEQDKKST